MPISRDEADLKDTASRFESLLSEALNDKYQGELFEVVKNSSLVFRWDLIHFLDRYFECGVYPVGRAAGVLYKLIDFKLQLYYIHEIDLGLYNRLYFDEIRRIGSDTKNPPPRLLLQRLSLDQNIISKSRILWERLMNLIYYLETGRELETRKSSRRSKKAAFFRWAADEAPPNWRFMSAYESSISNYDQNFRTPEFHKHSVLRSELLGQKTIDLNALLNPINLVANAVWENMLAIICGGSPTTFTGVHMLNDQSHIIDPRYLHPE